jgi:hypothetical protein
MKMEELFSERPAERVSDPPQVDANCPPGVVIYWAVGCSSLS